MRFLTALLLFVFLGFSSCDLLEELFEDHGNDRMEVEGIVTTLGDSFLAVGDASYAVTDETEFEGYDGLGEVEIGDEVEVEYRNSPGGRIALEVERLDGEGDDDGELEIVGLVSAVGDTSVTVGDASYRVTEGTEFEGYEGLGDVEVGDEVEIEYALGDGGTRIALEIEYLGG